MGSAPRVSSARRRRCARRWARLSRPSSAENTKTAFWHSVQAWKTLNSKELGMKVEPCQGRKQSSIWLLRIDIRRSLPVALKYCCIGIPWKQGTDQQSASSHRTRTGLYLLSTSIVVVSSLHDHSHRRSKSQSRLHQILGECCLKMSP